jgi:hypothetical protein
MKIKKVHRNVPVLREVDNRFRVKFGDRNDFELLQVQVKREQDGSIEKFEFKSRDLPLYDSIHFNTSVERGKLQIKWDGAQPIQSNWKIYTQKQIEALIVASIRMVQKKDAEFLNPDFDINERSVTHRLAMYLAGLFPEEDVDCEYNRIYNDDTDEYIAKNLELPVIEKGITLKDTKARTVFPDIIVHRRNTQRNLLAIEVKMAWKADKVDFDRVKAQAYKFRLNYEYSICLILGPFEAFTIQWIQ